MGIAAVAVCMACYMSLLKQNGWNQYCILHAEGPADKQQSCSSKCKPPLQLISQSIMYREEIVIWLINYRARALDMC